MKLLAVGAGLILAGSVGAMAQDAKPEDTEIWSPQVPVVSPGKAAFVSPPSDALVLFDGSNLSQWTTAKDGSAARWTVADGAFTVKKGTGNIQTRKSFGDYQLHLEYRIPANITGKGQARGNSGLFLASTGNGDEGYEMQILDNYNNATYVNGQLGSIYKQLVPLANPARKPGEWQTVDVLWTAPVFAADGTLKSPAYITAHVNGILVQNHAAVRGGTRYIGQPVYTAHGKSPIKLQDHGDPSEPISFRNIWIRELPSTVKTTG